MSKKEQDMSGDGSWRYQAVYHENSYESGDTYCWFSICEVYLDKDGRLKMWTEEASMAPSGESIDELAQDVQFMLDDVAKWKPVMFGSLEVGMVFERN